MPIPSEIIALANQLNQELTQIEQNATEGLNIINSLLSSFPENITLTGLFAFFSNVSFSIEVYRRRIQATLEEIASDKTTEEEMREAGEDLATLLGTILEVKMEVIRIVNDLEDFR